MRENSSKLIWRKIVSKIFIDVNPKSNSKWILGHLGHTYSHFLVISDVGILSQSQKLYSSL